MVKRSYSLLVLFVFAFVMTLVYLASYVKGVIDDTDNLSKMWYYLIGGIVYLVAGLMMAKETKISWYLFMVGLLLTIFISLFVSFSLESLPTIVLAIFVMLYLLDEDVKRLFDVKFSVRVKL